MEVESTKEDVAKLCEAPSASRVDKREVLGLDVGVGTCPIFDRGFSDLEIVTVVVVGTIETDVVDP